MNEEKEIWIESVMNSHKGKMDLVPNESLFEKILAQTTKVKPISVRHLGLAGVAASVLVIINAVAIQSINTQTISDASYFAYEDEIQLISDYNLYDEYE
jgi:hypothetical protein